MSWQSPTQFEQELLANLRYKLAPELLSLAKYLAVAPRVEPLLLRNLRTTLMPASEPELEHHLWFSALVSARSAKDIVLNQGAARLLADELHNNADEFARVWELTQRLTAQWPPLDKLELKLRYDVLQADQNAINKGLQEVLRAIHRAGSDQQKQLGLARWAKKILPAIASETTDSNEVAWLAQYAATILGATSSWTKLSASTLLPNWLSAASLSTVSEIGLQLRYDAEYGYQVLECLPPADAPITLTLPTPLPAKLYIQCENQSEGAWEVINPGIRIKIKQPSHRIELRTIDGKRYELLADFEPSASASAVEASKAVYLTYVSEDMELAQRIAQQLAEHNIKLSLLSESPADINRLKAYQNHSSKFLRLWTPAAQRHWQSDAWEDFPLTDSSLLLRWNQTELPQGAARSLVVDWNGRLPDIGRIQEWLAGEIEQHNKPSDIKWLQQALNDLGANPKLVVDGTDGPSTRQAVKTFQTTTKVFADGIAGPQTILAIEQQLVFHDLLKELENPQTTPRRRLAIGDRLAELGDPRKGVGVIEYEVIEYTPEIQRLLDELNDLNTQPPHRLEIGNRLAELGDPRPGVGLNDNGLPDIDWVEIPAGPFIYGEGNGQKTIEQRAYKISRYPVTNRQFQAFIDTGGYDDPQWWLDLQKPQPREPGWKQNNRPRETVSWFEAIAFTRWLSAQLGYVVSLPTEQQWEKAARGTDGRIYPWGNQYHSGYANCNETKDDDGSFYFEQTSAVGLCPQSDSPYGVADLAGNVWEWCFDAFTGTSKTDTVTQRVLRGGSWLFETNNLRSAYRRWSNANIRNNRIGFRLAQD